MAETVNQRWSAHLVGALFAGGVRDVVLAPGSRSTPLALACADHGGLRCTVLLDERAAGFVALGLAKASGAPVALLCTSGTAGAHFLPAVMEASATGVPLVALTANRPWDLQGFGAPQTIDQSTLFGGFVRARELLPTPEDSLFDHLGAVSARALHLACSAPRGPVHLDVPFREPLAPPDGGPTPRVSPRLPAFVPARVVPDLTQVNEAIARAKRPLMVCGPRLPDGEAGRLHSLAERLGAPLLAEAASNVRFGWPGAIWSYDALLRSEPFANLRPDLVLRFGGGLTSKVLQEWLDGSGARTLAFTEGGALVDPLHRVEAFVPGALADVCDALAAPATPDGDFRARWLAAQGRVEAVLDGAELPLEANAVRALVDALPDEAALMVSSSMPIRDLDAWAVRGRGPLRVHCNRGVNGIDGITSTALGVALASGGRAVLFTGDLALLHDLSGLVLARGLGVSLTVVVVNNDGGGIFGYLPVAERTPHFERLFGTPHGIDLGHAAALAGATLHRPEDEDSLRQALATAVEGGLHLVEVRTDRRASVLAHRAASQRLAEAGGRGC